jgi:hypothetical protein
MCEAKVVLAERGSMDSYNAWQTPVRQGAMVHRTLPDPAENRMLSLLEMPILVSELRSRDHGVEAFGGRETGVLLAPACSHQHLETRAGRVFEDHQIEAFGRIEHPS